MTIPDERSRPWRPWPAAAANLRSIVRRPASELPLANCSACIWGDCRTDAIGGDAIRRLHYRRRRRAVSARLDIAVMAGAPFLPASRDTIFAPASGAGRAAIAVVRVSGPRCAAALAALAPGKAFPDRVATLATLQRSRERRDARPRAGRPLRRAAQLHRRGNGGAAGDRRPRDDRRHRRRAGASARPAPGGSGRIRLARVRERQARSVRGRGPRRSRRRRDRGAAAPGAENRRRRAEPRRRGDPRHARRGDGADRGADRLFRRRGFRRAVARPGARDRRRGGSRARARRSPALSPESGCARASPSSSPARPTSANRR